MKILIAEDDAISRHLLEAFLQKWGYEVLVAKQGNEAWKLLQREGAPRLVILDWMMPGMDGVEICREAKRRSPESPLYVLLLTTRNQPQDFLEAFEAGADDYLTKPFDPRELKARVFTGGRLLELQEQLTVARQRLERESSRDSVTGLWNRTGILEMLRRELARAEREEAPVAVALGELDRVESHQEAHGEQIGDALLRETARRIRSSVRYYDSVGRYEGGKLLLVVPECKAHGALTQAQRLRLLIGKKPLDTPAGPINVTMSLGVAVASPAKPADESVLLPAAESALLRSKAAGGNHVELATSLEPEEGGPGVSPGQTAGKEEEESLGR